MYGVFKVDSFEELQRVIARMNATRDKIVAVTQNNNSYTVVFQSSDN